MTHPLELILHINWTKILSLEIDTYDDGEKWSTNLYFEIQRASSDLLLPSTKNLPRMTEFACQQYWQAGMIF